MYQSGRAGDEAKKRKSPAKSGRVGITAIVPKFQTEVQLVCTVGIIINIIILLPEKFLQFDWLGAVVFQLNLKYLHVKITNLSWVVV